MLFSIYKKTSSYFICNCLIFKRAEDGAQTRDPQLGKLMLYQLSYFRRCFSLYSENIGKGNEIF